MRIQTIITIICIGAFTIALGASHQNQLNGTWCVAEQSLTISFLTKDSLIVTSDEDTSIHGKGGYERTDSTFNTTVINEDMTLRMGYNYVFKNDSTIKAKVLFIIVNGDTADFPTEWMEMSRCSPKKVKSSKTGQLKPGSAPKK
jgi:hypothetical protein